ncbi:SNF2 family N-terminal domain-containing protein [Chaetomium sp. MPI-CAGE-AT-0009]|nr:SNF2 family N-terminal domain-containing protein [Chaetomium sp. MPI-CAGE-AT-0009]
MTRADAYAVKHEKKRRRRAREEPEDGQPGQVHRKRRRWNPPEHPPSTSSAGPSRLGTISDPTPVWSDNENDGTDDHRGLSPVSQGIAQASRTARRTTEVVEFHTLTSGSEMNSNVQYDTCFGLLELPSTITTSSAPDSAWFPVNVELCEKALRIKTFDSGQHMGSVSSEHSAAIYQLWENAQVVMTATVLFPHPCNRDLQYIRATLRVILYGSLLENDTVAKILSDGSLHLQHPSADEYTGRVPYFNPQYLLRPGGSMPDLESLRIPSPAKLSSTGLQTSLTEDQRNRLLQVFESAHDPDATFRIRPSKRLQSVLQDHQISALAMMVEKECGTFDEAVFPTLWEPTTDEQGLKSYRHVVSGERHARHPPLVRGGILADEMGLGKTLSAIALILWHIDALETSESDPSAPRATLIVTPKSTIPQWTQEFQRHVKTGCIKTQVHHRSHRQLLSRAWRDVDVVLTTYDTLRSEKDYEGPLFEMDWARVILDEAHNIRNRSSKVFTAAQTIKAQNRWCLTGTPIQNRLDDYGALLSFIRVPPFETADKFNHWVIDPAQKRKTYAFERLRTLVRATCLRRTKQNIGHALTLPKKEEVNVVLDLDPGDRELYDFFKSRTVTLIRDVIASSQTRPQKLPRPHDRGGWYGEILPLINHLRRICDHGQDLLHKADLEMWRGRNVPNSTAWLLAMAGPAKCVACGAELENDDGLMGPVELSCGHFTYVSCLPAGNVSEALSAQAPCSRCGDGSPLPGTDEDMSREYRPSVKIKALLQNLAREHGTGSTGASCKGVVFSCWTAMLNFIERALRNDGISYRRIDGQTTLQGRREALAAFQDDADCKVMLASIGSVAEGVNLSAANHVHIMEPHWNPMVEAQAVDRVHRIGQTRDVVITRYLIKNSIEFYVRGVQEDKLRMIHQSLSSTELSRPETDGRSFQVREVHSCGWRFLGVVC